MKLSFMKIKFLFIFMLILPILAMAEDVIVLRNGDIVKSNVLEVGQTEVKYKKISNPNGPTYTLNKEEILSINYENGEKDIFDIAPAKESDNINVLVDSLHNAELISAYNRDYTLTQKYQTGKKTKSIFYTLGMSTNSNLSNNFIEIDLNKNIDYRKVGGAFSGAHHVNNVEYYWDYIRDNRQSPEAYQIVIKNVSDKIIYIDLANCFRSDSTMSSKDFICYYPDDVIKTYNNGSSGGASIGLGSVASALGIGGAVGTIASGIGVSGGKQSGTSTTYLKDRIIAIPPHSEKLLSEPKWIETKGGSLFSQTEVENVGGHFEQAKVYEINSEINQLKMGESICYDYDSTPFKRRYHITWSDDQAFNKSNVMIIEMYARQFIGSNFKLEAIEGNDDHTIGSFKWK